MSTPCNHEGKLVPVPSGGMSPHLSKDYDVFECTECGARVRKEKKPQKKEE